MATSTEYARILPGTGYVLAPRVPRGLAAAVEGLAREVLRHRPEDIYVFAAQHFEDLVKLREETTASTVTKTENELERCNLVRARRIVESLETTVTKKARNQVNRSGWSINQTARVLRRCKPGFEYDIEKTKPGIDQKSPENSESTRKNLNEAVSLTLLKNIKLELRRNKVSGGKVDSGEGDLDEPVIGRRTRSLEIPIEHQRFERPGKTRSVTSAGSAENAIDRERVPVLSRPSSNGQGERERQKLEGHLENVERFDLDLRRMSESVLPIRQSRSGEEIPVSLPAVRPSSCKYSRNESRINVNELKNLTLPPISGDAARPKRRDNLTLPALPIAAGHHLGQRAETKLAVLGTSSSEYQEPTSLAENGRENNIELTSPEWALRQPGDIEGSDVIQMFPDVDVERNLKPEETFEDSLNVTPDSGDRSQGTDSLEPDVLEVENACSEDPENNREKEKDVEPRDTNELKDKLIEIEKFERSIERALSSSQEIAETAEEPNEKEEESKEIETQKDEPGISSDADRVTRESSARRTNSDASIQEEDNEKKDELPAETLISKDNNDTLSYVLTEGSPLEIPESVVAVTRNGGPASLFGERVQEDAPDDGDYLRGVKNTLDSKPLARQDLGKIKEEEEDDGVTGDVQNGQDEEEALPLKDVLEKEEKIKENSESEGKAESSTSFEEDKVDVDSANDGKEESPKEKDKSESQTRETEDEQSGQNGEEALALKDVVEKQEKIKEDSEPEGKTESSTSFEEDKVDVDSANDGKEESPKEKDKNASQTRETEDEQSGQNGEEALALKDVVEKEEKIKENSEPEGKTESPTSFEEDKVDVDSANDGQEESPDEKDKSAGQSRETEDEQSGQNGEEALALKDVVVKDEKIKDGSEPDGKPESLSSFEGDKVDVDSAHDGQEESPKEKDKSAGQRRETEDEQSGQNGEEAVPLKDVIVKDEKIKEGGEPDGKTENLSSFEEDKVDVDSANDGQEESPKEKDKSAGQSRETEDERIGQNGEEVVPSKDIVEKEEKVKGTSEPEGRTESLTSFEEDKIDVDSANDGQEESPNEKDKSAGESRETGESECWIEPKETTSSGRSNDSLSSDAPPRPYVPELNLDSLRDVTLSSSMKTSYLDEYADARKNGALSCRESETTSSFPETLPSEKKSTSEEVESPPEEEGNPNPEESGIAQERSVVDKREEDSSDVEEEIARELIGNSAINDLSPTESLKSNSSAHPQGNEEPPLIDDRAGEVNDHVQREQTINPEEHEEENAMLDAAVRKIQSRVRGFLHWKRRLRVAASTVSHPSDATDIVATLPSLIEEDATELSANIPSNHPGKKAENIADAEEVQEEKRKTEEEEEKVGRSENKSPICMSSGLQHTGEFHDSLPLALFVPRNGEIKASLSQKQQFNNRDTVLTRSVDCDDKDDEKSSKEDVPIGCNVNSPRPNVFYAMELSKALAQSPLIPSISSDRHVGVLPCIVHIDRASDVETPFPKLDYEHAVDDLREPLALPETPKPLLIEEISNSDKAEEKSVDSEEREDKLSEVEKGKEGNAMEVEEESRDR